MTIQVSIIADSISEYSPRLTTFQLRYPRFIHAEFMTHRVFSRNASSSRAIPVERLIQDILEDTAMPIHWGKNQPGMQAREEHDELLYVPSYAGVMTAQNGWFRTRDQAIEMALAFAEAGYHKQVVNRLLEPFSHINVIVTATDWENFFGLRSHPDAQPEIKMLSDLMQKVLSYSTANVLKPGEWHLPYIEQMDHDLIYLYWKVTRNTRDEPSAEELLELAKLVSTARCARVSYLTHDGRPTSVEEDIELARKLIVAQPLHASPAEHQATPDTSYANPHNDPTVHYENLELHGNFDGWIQHRKLLPNECIVS